MKHYDKSPLFLAKSTISMAMFLLSLPAGWSDNPRDGNLCGPDAVQNFLRVNNFEMRRGLQEMAFSAARTCQNCLVLTGT